MIQSTPVMSETLPAAPSRPRGSAARAYSTGDRDVLPPAVAATPALDRLLEVARAFDLPIALAAIPRGIERSLMERLGDEPQAHMVVHGLAHLNHAPPGEKKAEFGRHRPLVALARDALDSGGARTVLDRLIAITNSGAPA